MREIERVYREDRDKMIGILSRTNINKQAAEDIVQDTFLKLLENPPERGTVRDIVFASMWQRRVDHLRRFGTPMSNLKDDITLDVTENPEKNVINRDMINRICDGIKELNNKNQREILKMHFLHQMKPSEIDPLVPQNNGAIRKVIERFRTEVRRQYTPA